MGSHLNCAALESLRVCDSAFANAVFSICVSGRISSEGEVTVGGVAIGDIGTCVVIEHADSATAVKRRPMPRQSSPTHFTNKFMRACSSGTFFAHADAISGTPTRVVLLVNPLGQKI